MNNIVKKKKKFNEHQSPKGAANKLIMLLQLPKLML